MSSNRGRSQGLKVFERMEFNLVETQEYCLDSSTRLFRAIFGLIGLWFVSCCCWHQIVDAHKSWKLHYLWNGVVDLWLRFGTRWITNDVAKLSINVWQTHPSSPSHREGRCPWSCKTRRSGRSVLRIRICREYFDTNSAKRMDKNDDRNIIASGCACWWCRPM